MDAAEKGRFTAEAKALRATYYFNLERLFRNIPLLLDPLSTAEIYNVTQATPADVYAQIEKDLTEAIPNLPGTLVPSTEAGRFTKGAAQAMLGKVYLYDNKKTEAASMLAQINGTPGQPNQYGNRLLPKFSDLWVFTNKFNAESILEAAHSDQSNTDWGFWGSSADEGNSAAQMVGPRSYSKVGPNAPDIYTSGWSFNVLLQLQLLMTHTLKLVHLQVAFRAFLHQEVRHVTVMVAEHLPFLLFQPLQEFRQVLLKQQFF